MLLYCVIVLLLIIMSVNAASQAVRAPGLSFAECVYVKVSGVCRTIANRTSSGDPKLLSTLKIVQLDRTIVRIYPINEAFVALTQPDAVFDITKETKIVIHGYSDSSRSDVPRKLAEEFNKKAKYNVLMLDAEEILSKSYISAVIDVKLIGEVLASLLAELVDFGASPEGFHLVGISLGAHIAGFAGKFFKQNKAGKVLGQITGLDPAGPFFAGAKVEQKLDKMDASYVDAIHSNRLMQGDFEALGHADFYLNGGGPYQPGCTNSLCSHLRAAVVYTESIRTPDSFVGVRCKCWKQFLANSCGKDFAVMGYGSPKTTRGLFYLRTAASPPFGLGMSGTKPVKYIKRPRKPNTKAHEGVSSIQWRGLQQGEVEEKKTEKETERTKLNDHVESSDVSGPTNL